jgi:hypothetical protein
MEANSDEAAWLKQLAANQGKEDKEQDKTIGPEELIAAVDAKKKDGIVAALKKIFEFIAETNQDDFVREANDFVIPEFLDNLSARGRATCTVGFLSGYAQIYIEKYPEQPIYIKLVDKSEGKKYEKRWSGNS